MRVLISALSVFSALADQCDDVVLLQVSSKEHPEHLHFEFPLLSEDADGLEGHLDTGDANVIVKTPPIYIPLEVTVEPHSHHEEEFHHEEHHKASEEEFHHEEFNDVHDHELNELDAIIDECLEEHHEMKPLEFELGTAAADATIEEVELLMMEEPELFTEETWEEAEEDLAVYNPDDKFWMLPSKEDKPCARRNAWLHHECDENWNCHETDTVVVGDWERTCECEMNSCMNLLPADFKFCDWDNWDESCNDEWQILKDAGYYDCTHVECSHMWRDHNWCGIVWPEKQEQEFTEHPVYEGAMLMDHTAVLHTAERFCDQQCELDTFLWKKQDEQKIAACKDTIPGFWDCANELALPYPWEMSDDEKWAEVGDLVCEEGMGSNSTASVLKQSDIHLKARIANLARKSKNAARAFIKSQAPHLLQRSK